GPRERGERNAGPGAAAVQPAAGRMAGGLCRVPAGGGPMAAAAARAASRPGQAQAPGFPLAAVTTALPADAHGMRWWPAPAKLNLFLHVNGRRPDGYHELQTIFQLLDWGDE